MHDSIENEKIWIPLFKISHIIIEHCLRRIPPLCTRQHRPTITKLHDRFIEWLFPMPVCDMRIVVCNAAAGTLLSLVILSDCLSKQFLICTFD